MMNGADLSGKLALDASGLNSLKQAARDNSPEAVRAVAKQFESLFLNMMLKSMREATPQDSPLENEQTRAFTSMLDQQLSQNIANRGLGLAEVLTRQLTRQSAMNQGLEPAAKQEEGGHGLNGFYNPFQGMSPKARSASQPDAANARVEPAGKASLGERIQQFQNKLMVHADEAARATGIPANLMLGQAALESGWGRREIRGADGSNSHNLFGIKAGANWNGKVVEAVTTEYVNGVPQKRVERFRAYDSYADSFRDFGNLIKHSPRYSQVMANLGSAEGYAQALQQAGYATDPHYANKLSSVIRRVSAA